MKKICLIVGARPNFVKVAPLVRAISQSDKCEYELLYAGREDDPTLEPTLFDDLQMPRPNVFLGVSSQSLNDITAQVMGAFDHYLDEHPADVVIVVDDLASTMAAAITAKKRGVKLAHLVAGTRSFDITMPKEVNRLVIDALSDYLFTAGIKTTSVATREQQSESSQTYMVGNILMDSLRFNLPRFTPPPSFHLTPGSYIVLTLNRKALLTDEQQLRQMLQTLISETADVPIVAPLRNQALGVVVRLLTELQVASSKCALYHTQQLYRASGDRHRRHQCPCWRRCRKVGGCPQAAHERPVEDRSPSRPLGRSHRRPHRQDTAGLIIFRGCCDTPADVVARLSQNAEGVATTSAFFHGKSWKLANGPVGFANPWK